MFFMVSLSSCFAEGLFFLSFFNVIWGGGGGDCSVGSLYLRVLCWGTVKVTVYTLLMNYSYETVYCCWAESLLLAQISMMYYESAPKIMFCSENLGFIGQSDAFLWLI